MSGENENFQPHTYRKRPVEVEAIQFAEDGSNWKEVCRLMDVPESDLSLHEDCELPEFLDVMTEHGWTELDRGQWLVKNTTGRKDVWPVAADIFEASYARV